MFIGAAILVGALVGGGVGATVSIVEQHREAEAAHKEFQLDVDRTARTALVGAGVGALGGGIVGIGGVALAAAATPGIAVTAASASTYATSIAAAGGMSAVGSAAGYLAAAGPSAKVDDAFLATEWGFFGGAGNRTIMGPASGAIGQKIGGSPVSSGILGGVSTAGEYASRQIIHGDPVNGTAFAANALWGFGTNAADRGLFGPGQVENPLMGMYSNWNWARDIQRANRRGAIISFTRTSGEYWLTGMLSDTTCRQAKQC